MPRRTRPWQQSYRRIPPHIDSQLEALPPGGPVVVACARRVTVEDIERGVWDHTGIRAEAGMVAVPAAFLPPREMGRHSRWNIDGRRMPLKDRPKVHVTYSWDSPNYGDYSKGSHSVSMDREVWQKETLYGKALEITMEPLGEPAGSRQVAFKVPQPLIPTAANFQRELLEAVNLLQENVGGADIHSSDASAATFARTVRVDWELLPVGTVDEMVRAVEERLGRGGGLVPDTVRERMEVFRALGARNTIVGRSGFSRYIGAQIQDDLVVLENPIHGNAIYVLGSDWAEVSQRSRTDLLRDETAHYERIVHQEGWAKRLRDIINARRA